MGMTRDGGTGPSRRRATASAAVAAAGAAATTGAQGTADRRTGTAARTWMLQTGVYGGQAGYLSESCSHILWQTTFMTSKTWLSAESSC